MLQLKQFYAKAVKYGYELMELSRLCAHVAYENFQFSNKIAKKLLVGINKGTGDDVQGVLQVMEPFIHLKDSYN